MLAADRRVIIFGEDVGVKGGVYGVTARLARKYGTARVFDTLLDEQAILGLGLGAGLAGLIPIPEVQYLAYLHNAEDQLRGEAATLPFFSRGRFTNPMVVRIAGLGYQKGFGGHFHNDNAVAVLRDIPGLVLACPARADDAAAMLRTCVAAAITDSTLSVFLEPIALYHRRDLYEAGDQAWLAADHDEHVPIGRARVYLPLSQSKGALRQAQRTARIGSTDHDQLWERSADELAGSPPACVRRASPHRCWTCAGWLHFRSRTSSRQPDRRAESWWSMRRGTVEAWVKVLSLLWSRAASRARSSG